MSSPQEHYERLLARHYSWMQGGHNAQVPANVRNFAALGVHAAPAAKALDLGCGSGFQSLALAQIGFRVVGVDTSPTLLDELHAQPHSENVTTICGDMRNTALYAAHGPFELVVCMGDSLTHLATLEDIEALLRSIRSMLRVGGKLVLGFRDLSREMNGIDRALSVRSDADRILTVFLEYESKHVVVNDLMYVRENGAWVFAKSSYRKLRLNADHVIDSLKSIGFSAISHSVERGFSTIFAKLENY